MAENATMNVGREVENPRDQKGYTWTPIEMWAKKRGYKWIAVADGEQPKVWTWIPIEEDDDGN